MWVAGFVGYEAAPAFDPALVVAEHRNALPLAWFVVAERRERVGPPAADAYQLGDWKPRISEVDFQHNVDRIRALIRSGETYQVNFTFRLDAPFEGSPEGFYRWLVNSQACGYGALLETEDWAIVSASPELFFEWHNGRIVSKPMKGTRERGLRLADDENLRAELEASEKDRAENLMIVDMVRNDLGRVARTGSVNVPALFATEKYDTVWQLTSTVAAESRTGTRLNDVFAALFPCASITGAPKVRTMEIIANLEREARGVYCGAIGFGGPDRAGEPQWVFNVAIRTTAIDRRTNQATYGTGGGITYDSTSIGEFDEAMVKTKVLSREIATFELLETIRWDGSFHLLDRHLTRLAESARYFDIPLDLAETRAVLRASVAGVSGAVVVRLTVDRTGWMKTGVSPLPGREPVRVSLNSTPVDPDDVFLYHKTTNRRLYEHALSLSDADDVVLIDGEGHITETTIANVAVLLDDIWWTPPVSCGLLPGTERAELLASGRIRERPISIEEARSAMQMARFNSVRGWEMIVLEDLKGPPVA
jgi:para-aminobenzoate synthetase/4-amino-4-deoxychorismate lyase